MAEPAPTLVRAQALQLNLITDARQVADTGQLDDDDDGVGDDDNDNDDRGLHFVTVDVFKSTIRSQATEVKLMKTISQLVSKRFEPSASGPRQSSIAVFAGCRVQQE